jgi:hypothetical protein
VDRVQLALAAQVLVQVALVRLAPVALPVLALAVAPAVLNAQALVAEPLVLVAVHQASADHVRLVAQVLVAAVTVVEPLVRSVRAVAVVHRRHASQSVRNAKSSNREWLLALVAQLCHVAMVLPSYVCVADQASKTLPTRLKPLQLS